MLCPGLRKVNAGAAVLGILAFPLRDETWMDTIMTDRGRLRIVGFILTGVTAIVIGVGIFVVQGYVTGRHLLDEARPTEPASLPTAAP